MASPTYDLIRDVESGDERIEGNPSWAIAVVRLGYPVTYSRQRVSSIETVQKFLARPGAFTRKDGLLLITSDCINLNVSNSKGSPIKNLNATLKPSMNYLASDGILPGDWVMAWMWDNSETAEDVTQRILRSKHANGFGDGLKFVGRAHGIRKHLSVAASGEKTANFSLEAVGFEEMMTSFYFDRFLANMKSELPEFMKNLGFEYDKLVLPEYLKSGDVKNNVEKTVLALIDILLGKGPSQNEYQEIVKRNLNDIKKADKAGANTSRADDLQATAGASPFSYLVPRQVGTLLGLAPYKGTKESQVFGYSDILVVSSGIQEFDGPNNTLGTFIPKYAEGSTTNRLFPPKERTLRGTILPIDTSLTNTPLWSLITSYVQETINEAFTALKPYGTGMGGDDESGDGGRVFPTLIMRQIPFSTNAADNNLVVTKFSSLPAWKVSPLMVKSMDIGRNNTTRKNMVSVLGNSDHTIRGDSLAEQYARNPPIWDNIDIARSGVKPYMQVVQCALSETFKKPDEGKWNEIVADWVLGSHLTLNGTLQTIGIQAPISEGDALIFEDMRYYIEGVNHSCSIDVSGNKRFETTFQLSNGMPENQGEANDDFPKYPGISNIVIRNQLGQKTTTSSRATETVRDTESVDDFGSGTTDASASTSKTKKEFGSLVKLDSVSDDNLASTQDPGHSEE